MKRIWFQFYPGDWTSEPGLKVSSLEARGLAIEMVCIMHQSDPTGYLEISGIPLDYLKLARVIGADPEPVKVALHEVLQNRVFSVTRNGVIYSRRMVKEDQKRKGNRDRQQKLRSKSVTDGVTDDESNAGCNNGVTDDILLLELELDSTPIVPLPTFDDFWKRYPKKVGRKKAEQEWDKAIKAGTDPHQIMAGLDTSPCLKTNPKYIPNPATWLHQGRWDDEPEQPASRFREP